jgi:hypothetical protein
VREGRNFAGFLSMSWRKEKKPRVSEEREQNNLQVFLLLGCCLCIDTACYIEWTRIQRNHPFFQSQVKYPRRREREREWISVRIIHKLT